MMSPKEQRKRGCIFKPSKNNFIMRKKLLILGGGFSHIEIIKIANRMGLETIVMDRNPKAVGFRYSRITETSNPSDPISVYNVAKKHHVSGIIPTGDYSVYSAAFACEKLGLPTIGKKVAKLAINKSELFKKFKKDKVPIPPSERATNVNQAKKLGKNIGFPLILKPGYSFGASRGVVRIDDINELERFFDYAKSNSFSKDIIIEKYIDGTAHSVESITINRKTYPLAISEKVRTHGKYYVDLELHYPYIKNKKIIKKLLAANEKAIRSLGIINGLSHVEAISIADNVYIFDFGARGGAGGYIPSVIVPNVCGVNMMEKMILLSIGENVGSLRKQDSNNLIYGFFVAPKGKIKKITGLKKSMDTRGIVDFQFWAKVGDINPELKQGGERIGYFVVKARNIKEVEIRAKQIRDSIKIHV